MRRNQGDYLLSPITRRGRIIQHLLSDTSLSVRRINGSDNDFVEYEIYGEGVSNIPELTGSSFHVVFNLIDSSLVRYSHAFYGFNADTQRTEVNVLSIAQSDRESMTSTILHNLIQRVGAYSSSGIKADSSIADDLRDRPVDSIPPLDQAQITAISDRFPPSVWEERKLIFIDFWYRTCYPCRQSVPMVAKLAHEFESRGMLTVGIDPVDNDTVAANEFQAKFAVRHPTIFNDRSFGDRIGVTERYIQKLCTA